ncbi:UNVERIFIED_CONTAM: hypothetical protein PYX00_006799 [Menopon gallinae]|uniref:Thyrotropin-releasing hormone receptor n=1 Tax=Menopon gallinae TaxID=328185 RepID=A0AAW2HWE3_9NEOP
MATVPNEILSYHVSIDRWLTGNVGCILHVFSYNIGINASSLSLVAFTVERYVAICHPMKAHTGCTVRRAKKVILIVWIFTICYCTPWLFLTGVTPLGLRSNPQAVQCNFLLPREKYLYIYLADMFLFYVVPLSVSCYLYICIARVLLSRGVSTTRDRASGAIHLEMRSGSSTKTQVSLISVISFPSPDFFGPVRRPAAVANLVKKRKNGSRTNRCSQVKCGTRDIAETLPGNRLYPVCDSN